MRGLIAALGAVFVIAAAPAAQADVQPYAANDAGGFHDVLPPGANGLANGVELARLPDHRRRGPRTTTTSCAMYRDLMYATPGLKAAGPRALLQGLDASACKPGGRRVDRQPARRRDDPARQRLRRPAHLRRRRAAGRCSAPATPPPQDRLFFIDVLRHLGPRAAVVLHRRRAGQPRDGRRAVVARALHRGRLPAPVRPRRRPLRRARAPAAGRRAATTSPASTSTSPRRGWTRPRCPASTRRSASRRGPTHVEGDRHHLHRLARRRHLRQGRRARARRVPAARRVQGPLRREAGPHALGAVRAPSTTPTRRPRSRARASRTRPSRRSARRAPRSCPIRARSRRSRSRARTAPPAPAARGGRCPGADAPRRARRAALPGIPPLPGLPLPELGALPKAMSNALLVSGADSASRPPARGLRPAGRATSPREILMEEDLHGAGRSTRGRGLPGRQPLRPARPRPRLRVERDLGRPGHHRHLRGAAVRRRRTTASAASACRSRCSSARTRWTPNLADQTPPGSETLRA